ncbi:MAG: hypothetical protein AUF65_01645 [Chloroflexi bacterium 13_1_20CM_50_12]|nr:MAG: hypothetical protein AUF65_01645 [Chloroflexi bacterium 13_1_20CM_50_12]
MIRKGKENYLNATEAAECLGVARKAFYEQYKKDLATYTVGKRKRPYYRQTEVEALNVVKPIEQSFVVEQTHSA